MPFFGTSLRGVNGVQKLLHFRRNSKKSSNRLQIKEHGETTISSQASTSSLQSLESPRISFTPRNTTRLIDQWDIVAVPSDGNCLFAAISEQLFGTTEYHRTIRLRTIEYIQDHYMWFQPFVEHEDNRYETIARYCSRMYKNGQWGGHPELFAAAKIWNLRIVVHQEHGYQFCIDNGYSLGAGYGVPEPVKNLHLRYHNNHYDSLWDRKEKRKVMPAGFLYSNAHHPHQNLSKYVSLPNIIHEEEEEIDGRLSNGKNIRNSNTFRKVNKTEIKYSTNNKRKRVRFLGPECRFEEQKWETPEIAVELPTRASFRKGKTIQDELDVTVLYPKRDSFCGGRRVSLVENQDDELLSSNATTVNSSVVSSRTSRASFTSNDTFSQSSLDTDLQYSRVNTSNLRHTTLGLVPPPMDSFVKPSFSATARARTGITEVSL